MMLHHDWARRGGRRRRQLARALRTQPRFFLTLSLSPDVRVRRLSVFFLSTSAIRAWTVSLMGRGRGSPSLGGAQSYERSSKNCIDSQLGGSGGRGGGGWTRATREPDGFGLMTSRRVGCACGGISVLYLQSKTGMVYCRGSPTPWGEERRGGQCLRAGKKQRGKQGKVS